MADAVYENKTTADMETLNGDQLLSLFDIKPAGEGDSQFAKKWLNVGDVVKGML